MSEGLGIRGEGATITDIRCELCGAWIPVYDATIADLNAGQITVPAHAMDRERNGTPCSHAGTVVRP